MLASTMPHKQTPRSHADNRTLQYQQQMDNDMSYTLPTLQGIQEFDEFPLVITSFKRDRCKVPLCRAEACLWHSGRPNVSDGHSATDTARVEAEVPYFFHNSKM
jgi:hypothetical protein